MKKFALALAAAFCLTFAGAVDVLPEMNTVSVAHAMKSQEGYMVYHNNYFIRYYEPYNHYSNIIDCEYHKPSRIEYYKIKFFRDHFVVLETDADKNEIGIQQYYGNNPGTYKVMSDAWNRGFIHP